MSRGTTPLQLRDANGFIIPFRSSDAKLKVIFASDLFRYYGWARPGAETTNAKWRIVRETLNAGGNTVALDFAEGSNYYDNIWDLGTSMAISGASQADPCVITVADTSTLASTDKVLITGVAGMTELNDVYYNITVINGTTFSLQTLDGDTDVDSTAFTAYTTDGTIFIPEYLNYSFS